MTDTPDFWLYGTREPPAASQTLVAGPLSVTLEDGNLRTIRFCGHEVLRAIAFLVRDKDWGTCQAELDALEVTADATGFSVRYTACYASPTGARLDCAVEITGQASGQLRFIADYVADGDFQTARAGFTVLHPINSVSGKAVSIEHSDGAIDHAHWPSLIEPWQPFKDIAAITHHVCEGLTATTRFSGDVFEMEDQRNWTDSSFKTYVRPLALPWPYLVRKGVTHHQSVVVEMIADASVTPANAQGGPDRLVLEATQTRLPLIGIGLRPECKADEIAAIPMVRSLGFHHLIAPYDPLAGDDFCDLQHYSEMQRRTGLPLTLELALPCVLPVREELSGIADLVASAGLVIDILMISPAVDRQSTPPGSAWPECPPLQTIYAAARDIFAGIRLGGGMLSYFTELNRKRVPGAAIDLVSHCTNPIVHAADDLSVMQSFEALGDVVTSVRAIYATMPYRIGPSTIAMRQNPYGSATKANSDFKRIPMANVDPRHNGQFGAAWTLAYAARVAFGELDMLTLSTLAGPFGLLASDGEPAEPGALRPLAHVLGELACLAGRKLIKVTTSDPAALLGLAASDGQETTLLVANITPETRSIDIGDDVRAVALLDPFQTAALQFVDVAATGTLTLGPYGCAKILI